MATRDWRNSAKANELREFIDQSFKVKKPTLGNLERELIIDFVAKERDDAKEELRVHIEREVIDSYVDTSKPFGVSDMISTLRSILKV